MQIDDETAPARDGHRLDAFVDAAFAFAVSLLVIGGAAPPTDFQALAAALERIPAFAAGFAMVAVFWAAHRNYGRLTPRRDALSTVLSLAVVFVVLVYVYPLRMLAEAAIRFFSAGRLGAGVRLSSFDELAVLYTVFAAGFCVLAYLLVALFGHAARAGARLGLDAGAQTEARASAVDWLIVGSAGILSALLAQVLPMRLFPWAPGFAYWLIPVAMGVRVYIARRGARRNGPRSSA